MGSLTDSLRSKPESIFFVGSLKIYIPVGLNGLQNRSLPKKRVFGLTIGTCRRYGFVSTQSWEGVVEKCGIHHG